MGCHTWFSRPITEEEFELMKQYAPIEISLSLDCGVERMFRRKTKLKKVLDKRINYVTFRDFLKSLSHKELHILAEEIIWKEYDGYNGSSCYMEQNHYDLIDRWHKEFYIEERSYLLSQ